MLRPALNQGLATDESSGVPRAAKRNRQIMHGRSVKVLGATLRRVQIE